MYSIHLNFKNKTKKLTISKNLSAEDLTSLISHSFNLKQKLIGLTNANGQFFDLNAVQRIVKSLGKQIYYLITAQDLNQDNMSFASESHEKNNNLFSNAESMSDRLQKIKLPQEQSCFLGLIGDLQLFQELLLDENRVVIVFCFIKHKPKIIQFPYYLFHTNKNSAIIYSHKTKVCQFFIDDMKEISKQIFNFANSLMVQKEKKQSKSSRLRQVDRELDSSNENNENQECEIQNEFLKSQEDKEIEMRQSLIDNLIKLKQEQDITELQFYKMKSQLYENIGQFIRKYQMGTRNGLRREVPIQMNRKESSKISQKENDKVVRQIGRSEKSRQGSSNRIIMLSRDQRRSKKYQIPIIVRKYNNVIEKISTSYPLSQEQQQAINLILELQLKGLISQKQSGIYKSSILQQDSQVFSLFVDYFNGIIDQIQLVGKLKRIKKIGSQKRQRAEHNMRLLMKHSRQCNYQLLRTLLLEGNTHVINSLEYFRSDKNSQILSQRLEKIAHFYRQKETLEQILDI